MSRPSIAQEKLPRAFYAIRPERPLMELLIFDLLS